MNASTATSRSYAQFAGALAILAGLVGIGYATAFVVLKSVTLSALALMLGGLLSTAVIVALYELVRGNDDAFATWALLLSAAGALGATVHGGFDLANAHSSLAHVARHPGN